MVCLAPILQYGLFLEHSLCRKQSNSVVLAASIFRELSDGYYNGLNLIITYTLLGVPCYHYGIMGPETLF